MSVCRVQRGNSCTFWTQRNSFTAVYLAREFSRSRHGVVLTHNALTVPSSLSFFFPLLRCRRHTSAYAALTSKRDRLMVRCGFGSDADSTGGGDVEEDLGEDAAVTRSISLPTMTLRAPPASERASVVNPIFAGSGSRMKRNPWPGGSAGGGGGGGERPSRRTSLASIETDMSSGELDAAENQTSGCSSARHSRESPAGGRRAEWGAAAAGSGGVLPSHPSSWAGYGGGGAAAWVRSSRDVTAPPPRGGKGGHRRANSRY